MLGELLDNLVASRPSHRSALLPCSEDYCSLCYANRCTAALALQVVSISVLTFCFCLLVYVQFVDFREISALTSQKLVLDFTDSESMARLLPGSCELDKAFFLVDICWHFRAIFLQLSTLVIFQRKIPCCSPRS